MFKKSKFILAVSLTLLSTLNAQNSFAWGDDTSLSDLPTDALGVVLSHLPRVEVGRYATVCQKWSRAARTAHTIKDNLILNSPIVQQFLAEMKEVPEVTQHEVDQLKTVLTARHPDERTYIQQMPKFRVAKAMVSIGLYHAVMDKYPSINEQALKQQWIANPDLPLTGINSTEENEFLHRFNFLTGRKFKTVNDSQDEYVRRGRSNFGHITSSIYYFGDNDHEVSNHAFMGGNLVHGVHETPEGREANFTNSFGLIHTIGNVYSRSASGMLRGGCIRKHELYCRSSFHHGEGDSNNNYASTWKYSLAGVRLVEDITDEQGE